MKSLSILTLLFFLDSCTAPHADPDRGSKIAMTDEAVPATSPEKPAGENDFEQFLERFNRDSVFQLSSVKFPLKWKSWADDSEDMERYDVLRISKEEYDIEFLADSVGNYIENQPTSAKIERIGPEYRVKMTVEDSGIHIVYFFRFRSKWELYLVEDSST